MENAREMTCIACPMGCRMLVRGGEDGVTVQRAACKRGTAYGIQEYTCPMRTVTSSVRVSGGARPLCAVKTQKPVPKASIPAVLAAISASRPGAPIEIGQVIVPDAAGTGVDIVATARCEV